MQQIMKTTYESIMILLVMLTIVTLWSENTYNSTINWIVWAVFFIDFVVRLTVSKEKWNFIKQNPFLVIAIIPFDQFFQIARIVRIIYLFRIKTITKYYISPYIEKLSFQSMSLIGSIILVILFAESLFIWNVESSIQTYYDALFVVFGYLLFFGHEIYIIGNQAAIWTLTGISILGIVVQGIALQWAFTKVETLADKYRKKKKSNPIPESDKQYSSNQYKKNDTSEKQRINS
ncbi:transporter [Virgibacillus oceani]|uniref:Ion transporter n=1 Tax=Virgibacillus oceani TaxID=1479511 RepID=A0A917HC21_9BACI|nr:transporter [Virgibacillus oceani]GGG74442.1 ion transporter [Virgibacillus oceani]